MAEGQPIELFACASNWTLDRIGQMLPREALKGLIDISDLLIAHHATVVLVSWSYEVSN